MQINNPFSPEKDTLNPEARIIQSRKDLARAENDESFLKELMNGTPRVADPRLQTTVGRITLENPLIAAAGWDKFGEAVKGLYLLGFAGVEVGTISALPQEGNPQPRHFLLGNGVMLNRYGFNTPGMEVIAKNLEKYTNSSVPMGISLGKNKEVPDNQAPEAYAKVLHCFYDIGSYFVINVSSPNTPGLRGLQDKEPLKKIVSACLDMMKKQGNQKDLYVKIAPDMDTSAIDDVIDVVLTHGLTGIIATNTTLNGDIKAKYGENWRNEMGGLSGDDEDFRKMSTDIIRYIYKKAGTQMVIMGAGGIKDTATALEKLRAGAHCLQIMTAIQTVGPTLPGIINTGLIEYMEKNNISSISNIVGSEA